MSTVLDAALTGLMTSLWTIYTMAGCGRHIRHARKLAAALRKRASARREGCQFTKADVDDKAAQRLEEVCLYAEGKLGWDKLFKP